MLNSPLGWEELLIYLATSKQVVSVVLVRDEAGAEKSIFYVSKVLKGVEIKYMNIEKVVFAFLLAVRKFNMYLEDH